MEENGKFQTAHPRPAPAWRGFLTGTRIAAALVFFPMLALFLNLIRPADKIWAALKIDGPIVLAAVVIVSFFATADSFRSIIEGYKRRSGLPWRPSLVFAAGALNIIMALHWLLAGTPLP
jgi:hypothetical protein